MKRLPALAALLTMTFLLAACGGQSSQAPGAGEEQPEPSTEATTEGTTTETTERTTEGSAPEATASQSGQEGQAGSGYSVTTLDGERVSLGGGDATAIFFMAGW